MAEILRQALKESHREQDRSAESLLLELRGRHDQAALRLSNLFDEKMDGRIEQSFYDKKFTQYSKEKERFAKAISEHSDATTYDLEVKSAVFDLSQEGKNVYLQSGNEKRRTLVGMVFEPLTLHEGNIRFELKEEFALLSRVASGINGSKGRENEEIENMNFELQETGLQRSKDGSFEAVRSAWRRDRDSNPRYAFTYNAFRGRRYRPLCHLSIPGRVPDLLLFANCNVNAGFLFGFNNLFDPFKLFAIFRMLDRSLHQSGRDTS